jgi:hypothetical protein
MGWIRRLFRRESTEAVDDVSGMERVPQITNEAPKVTADNPITRPEDDALGRTKPAQSFAEQVLALDSTEGVVVGVLGPWGSGKTSFVNLARKRLKQAGVTVLEFNPWMFSGADQLVQAFFDTRLIVGRVVYRLVRALKDPQAVEAAVREILPHVASLSSKLELITDVGYREGAGHKLVSEAAAKSLEKEWRAAVRASDADTLARETDLLRTLILTKRDAGPDEPAFTVPGSVAVTQALLKSARSEVRSQSMGSRAVRRKPRLAWDALIEVCGNEIALRQCIEALKASRPQNIGDLLELADKYLAGWRPKDFGDD